MHSVQFSLMVANNKMRCLFAGVLFLLTFSSIFCLPACPSCSKLKAKRIERQTGENQENFLFENSTNIQPVSGGSLSQEDVTGNTIERPEYSHNVEPLAVDIPLDLKNDAMTSTSRLADYFRNSTTNCPDCNNGSPELRNSHKHIGCVCALFTTTTPFTDDSPLISKTFHNVSCHHSVSEEDACTRVCLSLALAYYKVKDNMICSHAHNATNLTASLHTKVCGEDSKWTFTGLSTNKPICCDMGKSVTCKNTETTSSVPEIQNVP